MRTASSGAEAVRLMERIPADLLITDIRMPDMDGIALMERPCPGDSRHGPSGHCGQPGYVEFKHAQKAIEYGARAYLLKPIDKAELFRAVEKVRADKLLDTGRTDSRARTEKSRRCRFFHYMQGGGRHGTVPALDREVPFPSPGAATCTLIRFPRRPGRGRDGSEAEIDGPNT
ncbi:MAG: response regulator [Lachnospiraceae bacterium]